MAIDYSSFPLAKPGAGKVTLTMAQRKVKLDTLCLEQHMACAICGRRMTREPDCFNTAIVDHITPEPRGCKKNDNDENLQAACWSCNTKKGSVKGRKPNAG